MAYLTGRGGNVIMDGVTLDIGGWSVKLKGETKKSRSPSLGLQSEKTATGLEIEGSFDTEVRDTDTWPTVLATVTVYFKVDGNKQIGGSAIIKDVEITNKTDDLVTLKVMVENKTVWTGLVPA